MTIKTVQSGGAPVIIVHLRRPDRRRPDEQRTDPFWEFGSFGLTGCHQKNLLSAKNIPYVEGARLAFAQGGNSGMKLVYLTPPVHVIRHECRAEVVWNATSMPFRYSDAPLLVDNCGKSDFPKLKFFIRGVHRGGWQGKFSSVFRTRSKPVSPEIAKEIIRNYEANLSRQSPTALAKDYVEALPYPPPKMDTHRWLTYQTLLNKADAKSSGRDEAWSRTEG